MDIILVSQQFLAKTLLFVFISAKTEYPSQFIQSSLSLRQTRLFFKLYKVSIFTVSSQDVQKNKLKTKTKNSLYTQNNSSLLPWFLDTLLIF